MGDCVGLAVALAAEKVGEVGEKAVGAEVFVPVLVLVVMAVVLLPRMLPGLEDGAEPVVVLMVLMVFVWVKLLGPVTLVVVVGEAKPAPLESLELGVAGLEAVVVFAEVFAVVLLVVAVVLVRGVVFTLMSVSALAAAVPFCWVCGCVWVSTASLLVVSAESPLRPFERRFLEPRPKDPRMLVALGMIACKIDDDVDRAGYWVLNVDHWCTSWGQLALLKR
jgi:hypothetical protein